MPTFERPCSIAAKTALPRVAAWFQANGYALVAKSPHELSLFHKAPPSHRLALRGDGTKVSFEFSDEQPEHERRVDQAMQGLTGLPSASAPKRCPACSTVAEAGATECAVCGSTL